MGFAAVQVLAGATQLSELGIDISKNWLTYLIKNLGDPVDAQDAATRAYVLAGLANYLLLAGGTMAGNIAMGGHKVTGLGNPVANQDAATKAWVLTQSPFSGLLSALTIDVDKDWQGKLIKNLGDPTAAQDAATRAYVLAQLANYLALAGGTMAGNIAMAAHKVTGLGAPTANNDAARKKYVDDLIVAYSKVVWKDVVPEVVSEHNRTTGVGWTDLDLTADTSPSAKIAILNLRISFDSVGAGGLADISVRSKDWVSGWYPQIRGGVHNGDIAGAHVREVAPCGMDASQTIQYTLGISGICQADFHIDLLGYIE